MRNAEKDDIDDKDEVLDKDGSKRAEDGEHPEAPGCKKSEGALGQPIEPANASSSAAGAAKTQGDNKQSEGSVDPGVFKQKLGDVLSAIPAVESLLLSLARSVGQKPDQRCPRLPLPDGSPGSCG